MTERLLDIRDLNVTFSTVAGDVRAVRDVSLGLDRGEILAIVGESGSGKTTLAAATIRLMAPNARIAGGSIDFLGEDLATATPKRLRALRGSSISMIFQNPRAALNPVRRIGQQIGDAIRAHRPMRRSEARERAVDLLDSVRFRDPGRLVDAYPHQLSGGMCQRAMIAMAIACEPALLIADEPTTALDATTQSAVMSVLETLIRERGMAMLLITHDLGLAAQHSDRVAVMEKGLLVETAAPRTLFRHPRHPYTRGLVAATPLRETRIEDLAAEPLPPARPPSRQPGRGLVLDVRNLTRRFDGVAAVDDVSFTLAPGESLGLVGESGSGKSTVARLVCRLIDPSAGTILFNGQDIGGIPERSFHAAPARRRIQLVFQDPTDSLNPRLTAFDAIADPLRRLNGLGGRALAERVRALCDQVRFPHELLGRRPHQLSGGQKARVGIARAISVEPDLLVLDEPTTALDVSVQAVILVLLERLKREIGLSYLFISHDLNVVKMMCDRTVVLRAGRVVEEADSREIFAAPADPYTRELLAAIPHLRFEDDPPAGGPAAASSGPVPFRASRPERKAAAQPLESEAVSVRPGDPG
ncbi:peptide/nickel transport system ATP-binding protein [Amorphus suaedae]